MRLSRHPLASLAFTALLISGCGALLGLDDFTDAAAPGAGGTTPCEAGDVRACYEGESETEGIGLCAPGKQTCDQDGRWGGCEGQVLPEEEDCDRRGDEDCDGVGCSDVVWARVFEAGSEQWATSVAVSPKGDRIAVAGIYLGASNFGTDATTVLPEHPSGGAFLAVFDGEGNHVYSHGLPISGDIWPVVAVDAESNVLFATSYTGTVNLGGEDLPSSGDSDLLIAKLRANGGHVWSKQFGGPETREADALDIAMAQNGDPVLTGLFRGMVSFGGPTLETAGISDGDGFLVRLRGEDGGHVYSIRIGDRAGRTPGYQLGKGVGVDAMGRVVAAGIFMNSVDFGTDYVHDSRSMGTSGWVAQYDAEGMLLWNTVFGYREDSTVDVSGVDVDPAGNAGILGLFSGRVTFRGTGSVDVTRETTGVDDVDIFVLRLSATGAHSWSKQIGDANDQSWNVPLQGVALDSEGEVVVAGAFRGKVDFGGGELTADETDWFIAKFDASGTHRWSHRYGSAAVSQGVTSAAILAETREVVVAGMSDGALDLMAPPLRMDSRSVVMARLSP
ncbi:uncharacterized protein SOCE26_008350 [Sorangium cellulosum]|uniref:Secreted protein n=1 Tax=Sorangium cellulosum TaxID=56 RepID=A0A2L0EJH2_SORCE|nr:uncharacterized protein SOCE26_008350 [Sorangium cellulosum]